MQPEPFGPYELRELLGRGGMGEVRRAYDTVRERNVALKRLLAVQAADDNFRARFFQECRSAAKLNEPHVVPIHDFGEIDGALYLDIRLIEGRDLARLLADRSPLPATVVVDLVTQVAAALDAAHAIALIHRDMKPSNVIVDESGPTPHCYLVDFGVASNLRSSATTSLTSAGAIAGTLDYIAPERLRREPIDHRVDVYSLACLLHELLTGKPPFPRGDTAAMCSAHLFDEPPTASAVHTGVPDALDAVIARGMAKDPDAPFSSAGGLAAAARTAIGLVAPAAEGQNLNTIIAPIPTAAEPDADAALTRRPQMGPRRRTLAVRLATLAALLVAIVVGGLVMAFLRAPAVAVAQPAGVPGKDPFMSAPDLFADPENGQQSLVTARTTVNGNTAGLYGGTLHNSCNPDALIYFFHNHPAQAAAWAAAQGISQTDIPRFVLDLTPVILRTDTAVTNHGYSDGRATPFQAILQAGTAVLVDSHGVPRVRCACGNPLAQPSSDVSVRLARAPWPGFEPGQVVVIRPAPAPIKDFVVVALERKPNAPAVITRPAGTTGSQDKAADRSVAKAALDYGSPGSVAFDAPDGSVSQDAPGSSSSEGAITDSAAAAVDPSGAADSSSAATSSTDHASPITEVTAPGTPTDTATPAETTSPDETTAPPVPSTTEPAPTTDTGDTTTDSSSPAPDESSQDSTPSP